MSSTRFTHTVESPFPVETPQGMCIDELCTCGARRSDHQDTIAFGHGACPAFSCPRFSFASRIYRVQGRRR